MPHKNQQVIRKIADFANEVLPTGLPGLGGRFDDFGGLFDDLRANRLEPAIQQPSCIGLLAWIRGPLGNRSFQFIQRLRWHIYAWGWLFSTGVWRNN